MLLNWHSFITAEQFPRRSCKTGSAAKRQIASPFLPKPQSLHEIIRRSKRLMCKKKKRKKKRSLLKQLKVFLSQTEAEDLFLLIITCKNHKIHRGLMNISIVSIVVKITAKKKIGGFLSVCVFGPHSFFIIAVFPNSWSYKPPDIYNAGRMKEEGKHEVKWKH